MYLFFLNFYFYVWMCKNDCSVSLVWWFKKKKNWGCGRIWSLSYANSIYRQIWAVALVDIPEKWYCNCSDLLQFCLQWAELLIKPWSESSSNSSSFFSWYVPLPQFSGQLFFYSRSFVDVPSFFFFFFFPTPVTCESANQKEESSFPLPLGKITHALSVRKSKLN